MYPIRIERTAEIEDRIPMTAPPLSLSLFFLSLSFSLTLSFCHPPSRQDSVLLFLLILPLSVSLSSLSTSLSRVFRSRSLEEQYKVTHHSFWLLVNEI